MINQVNNDNLEKEIIADIHNININIDINTQNNTSSYSNNDNNNDNNKCNSKKLLLGITTFLVVSTIITIVIIYTK